MLAAVAACLIVFPGPVVEPFAPVGSYAGHWGVDVAVAEGADVVAPLDGVVTFAGTVGGVRSVTIRSGEYRVSLTYLREVKTEVGARVHRGHPIGVAGTPHGRPGVHIGVRWGDRYVDPEAYACRARGTIRLLAPPILRAPGFED